MQTNYERVIKTFIPAFRLKAAKVMVGEHKIKQQRVAAMLGTTQAAISKYISEDSSKYENIKIDGKTMNDFVKNINNGDRNGAQRIMCSMCQSNKKFDCAFIVK